MPTVSAIIPSYNSARFVRDAIESALGQKNVETEVIVVDDGSTDVTWQILESFGPAIRRVRQPNAGPGPARNQGANLATGQWLAFLDADDVWVPDKLSKQLALTDANTPLVYSDCLNFGDIGRVKPRQSDSVSLHQGDIFESLLLDNFITLSTVLIRRDWFSQLGGFDESLFLGEDWDLWLRSAAEAPVAVCREPLTRYRWHPGGVSKSSTAMNHARLEVLQRTIALPRGRLVAKPVVNRAFANAWECSAWFTAPTHPRQAMVSYLRSLWHHPWNLTAAKGVVKCLIGRT